ncbi:MAG: SDR family NAD(P)-dependent oxidoreductase [Oceanicaulis sp.]
MTETRHVLFAGFGYVAEVTAARLAAAGWTVAASTRSAGTAERIADMGYAPVLADPASEAGAKALRAAVGRASALVSSVPPGEGGDPVLGALSGAKLGATRPVYLSTTGVYGDRQGGWAFERDAPTPGQARSVRRAEAESGWEALGAVLLRLGGIYGPGRSALDRIRGGETSVSDKPGQVFSRIHVADIASAIERMLETPGASGAFNIVDDHPSSQAEVLIGAARLLEAPEPEVTAFDPERASPMLASFYAECRRVSNARAKAVLGWRPAYPGWREGLAAILRAGG